MATISRHKAFITVSHTAAGGVSEGGEKHTGHPVRRVTLQGGPAAALGGEAKGEGLRLYIFVLYFHFSPRGEKKPVRLGGWLAGGRRKLPCIF